MDSGMSQTSGNVFDIDYEGWGPCAHNNEDKIKVAAWIKSVLPERLKNGYPEIENGIHGGLLEVMIWDLASIGAYVSLDCDQWVAVAAVGEIAKKKIKTYIQGDTFLIAMAETYRWWREKNKELTGEDVE